VRRLQNGPFPMLVAVVIWWLFLAGVAAPGQSAFTFAVVGDRTGHAAEGVFEQVLEDVSFLNPDLILTVGDHIQGYEPDSALVEDEWDYVVGLLDGTGIEYHLTPGNHDIWDKRSRAIYIRRFGSPDTAFVYEGNLFVIIDVSTHFAADVLPPAKMEWLERVLSGAGDLANVFVFYHKPFWCEDFSFGRPNAFHELFKRYDVSAVFTGHYHRHFYTEKDGIPYYGVSSSGGGLPRWAAGEGAFYSYLLANVDRGGFEVRLVEPAFGSPVDTVTMDDMMLIAGIQSKTIRMEELVIEGSTFSGTSRVSVTIENHGSSTLRDTARWVVRGGWVAEPMRDYVEVPPGEIGTLTAYLTNDGPLFPVPDFRLDMPYKADRVIEVSRPAAVKRLVHSEVCDSVPQLDGVLDEEIWQQLPGVSRYFGRAPDAAPEDSTVLKLRHDATRLYVAVTCFDSHAEEVSAIAAERDGFGGYDDYILLLFELRQGSRDFYQISVNPAGTIFDKTIEICPFGSYVLHPEWDAPVEVAAKIHEDRWTAEIAIPFEALGEVPHADAKWGFNFMRMHKRLDATSDLQPPIRYDSDYLAILQFR
jgi:hypothetical protein